MQYQTVDFLINTDSNLVPSPTPTPTPAPTPKPCPETLNNVNTFIPIKRVVPKFRGPYIRIQYANPNDARIVRGTTTVTAKDWYVNEDTL